MKKINLILGLASLMALMSGCSNNSNSNNNDEIVNPNKHVVTLTMDNYSNYIRAEVLINKYQNMYSTIKLTGTLNYGFYENCKISFYCNESNNTYQIHFNLNANATSEVRFMYGNFEILDNSNVTYKIGDKNSEAPLGWKVTNVSGTVTYIL